MFAARREPALRRRLAAEGVEELLLRLVEAPLLRVEARDAAGGRRLDGLERQRRRRPPRLKARLGDAEELRRVALARLGGVRPGELAVEPLRARLPQRPAEPRLAAGRPERPAAHAVRELV